MLNRSRNYWISKGDQGKYEFFKFGWRQWNAWKRLEAYKEQPKTYPFGGYHAQQEIIFA